MVGFQLRCVHTKHYEVSAVIICGNRNFIRRWELGKCYPEILMDFILIFNNINFCIRGLRKSTGDGRILKSFSKRNVCFAGAFLNMMSFEAFCMGEYQIF